ncbi:MAG: hypothetical protein NUW01_08835 [Gemmatimonadaceae bacterium]|nr:hypothetical protein [Gemmatimonadaceae bacterium]
MMAPYKYTALGFGSTAFGTASAATLPLPAGVAESQVKLAIIHVGVGAINYRDDGTAPIVNTAGTGGYPVAVGSDIQFDGLVGSFQAIPQTASGSATLSILYYG